MILSNTEIIRCLDEQKFTIRGITQRDPTRRPFNTSAVDLRLSNEIVVLGGNTPTQLDLSQGSIAKFLAKHSESHVITDEQPYSLKPTKFILGKTKESVDFPISGDEFYSARIEGKSSLARCGILVHFTAPTIHAGFSGTITLEIINLGPQSFLLKPDMAICQLIIEEVKGRPASAPSQFQGQNTAVGGTR